MFHPDYPLASLRGAEYNPRAIEDGALDRLARSLKLIGVGKPIIVNGKLIVAGHQRTRTLRRLGYETAPAFVLPPGLTEADEVRFNQLHNGTDFDLGDEAVRVPSAVPDMNKRFGSVPPDLIKGNTAASGAPLRAEICKLLSRYGNWGASVATLSGKVIHASQYALSCAIIGMPARVYYVADELADEARELLGASYGQFSYEHLPRLSYVQSFAQPFRLREDAQVANKSHLYDNYILPALRPGQRILDFGCGQGDYVRRLKAAGHSIHGVEFFYRRGNAIDTAAVHRMIDELCVELKERGPFDVVIADSVLNSVDSLEAESDVLTCLNAFARPGGLVFYSGRSRERFERRVNAKRHSIKNGEKAVIFLDRHGFSGILHHGAWFYQKFCDEDQVRKMTTRHFPNAGRVMIKHDLQRWRVRLEKGDPLPPEMVRAAIGREFNLPWPNGKSVERSSQVLAALNMAA